MSGRGVLARLGLIAGGLVLGVAFLVVVELALRLFGIGSRPTHDPFAGFSEAIPTFDLVEREDGTRVYDISMAREESATGHVTTQPQREFPASKEPGTFRIFVVGESSTAGVPYGTRYAFSSWLAQRLAADLPGRKIEIVNAAMSGYASRRVLAQMQEIAGYEPDLLIVYSGHNEYAERQFYAHLLSMDPRLFRLREWLYGTRLYAVLSGLFGGTDDGPHIKMDDARKGAQMFAAGTKRAGGKSRRDPREVEYGEIFYRSNLESIVKTMRAAGVPVMLLTLSQNFADWPPGASAHRPDLAPDDLARWEKHLAAGNALAKEHRCEAALGEYQQALAIDGTYAELLYEIAACERELGRIEEAREHYRQASDLDQVPHGAPTHFNDIVREVAQSQGAMLVDVDGALRAGVAPDLVGDNLFVDFVHPNVRGHQLIAAAVEEELRRQGLPAPAAEWRTGVYQDPSLDSLRASDPEMERQEHFMRAIAWTLSRHYEEARAELDAVLAQGPSTWARRLRNWVDRRIAQKQKMEQKKPPR